MSERSDSVLIEDMIEAAEQVVAYVRGFTFEGFLSDRKTQDAVVRNIEILGEAAGAVSEGVKDASPSISWKNIVGMRNRLIHGYSGVNWDIVWSVAFEDMPGLIKMLKSIHA